MSRRERLWSDPRTPDAWCTNAASYSAGYPRTMTHPVSLTAAPCASMASWVSAVRLMGDFADREQKPRGGARPWGGEVAGSSAGFFVRYVGTVITCERGQVLNMKRRGSERAPLRGSTCRGDRDRPARDGNNGQTIISPAALVSGGVRATWRVGWLLLGQKANSPGRARQGSVIADCEMKGSARV